MRNAITRITVILLVTCVAIFSWEAYRNSSLQPVTGHVTRVKNVFSSKGGDTKEFTINYVFNGNKYYFVTRRGIIDSLGALHDLKRGDSVALAVNPENPDNAVLNTFNGLYAFTLCFAVLTAIFFFVVLVLIAKGYVSLTQ